MNGKRIRSSEITPEHVYFSRRRLLKAGAYALGTVAGASLLSACGGQLGETLGNRPAAPPANAPSTAATALPGATAAPGVASAGAAAPTPNIKRDELGDPVNSWQDITNYNNFYEFTEDKEGVAQLAKNFQPNTWSITIGGLVDKPMTLDLDDIRTKFDQEERIYRLRCVEGWSMVIPWTGFPLAKLLKEVGVQSKAKFVRFESSADAKVFPNVGSPFYPWPYTEGLTVPEAMNDLTLLATGVYGQPLPGQSGAPVRLAVPWKYGFKSIKSIVKIDLVDEQPKTLWNTLASNEYGFYSNVNPARPHPRWSQATERRIGEYGRRGTLMFNGYAAKVADLYKDLDLQANY